jgi:KTSC domain
MVYSCAFVVRISNEPAAMLRICVAAFIATFMAIRSADCTEPSPTPSQIVSHIPRQPVESSAIAKVGYSKRRHILEIEFVNGAVYRYVDVPATVYHDLMAAESKARFYDSNIKRHYRSVLIRSRQKERVSAHSTE